MSNPDRSPFPTGVITATVTPMDRDLKADTGFLVSHCRNLLEKGGDGILLLGTTGEANSFSVAERKSILEGIIHGGISPDLVLVGTGCCAITDTVELTTHAVNHGVKNVLMLPPFYYKPLSDDVLFSWYASVIELVGDEDLRIYLYHIPQNTGIQLSMNLIARLIKHYPHTAVGMKDSGGDWKHMQSVMQEFPSFRLYSGSEEYLLDTLKAGGVGCISATVNVTMPIAAALMRAYRGDENTKELQSLLTSLRNVFSGVPLVGAIKSFLALESGNPAWNYVRPPNASMHAEAIAVLKEKYDHVISQKIFSSAMHIQ